MKKILEVSINEKRYKTWFKKFVAIKDVNFSIDEGEIWGLVGNNGAGKTTLIKSIVGGLNFKGTIKIGSFNFDTQEAKELIFYIPEKTSFPSGYKVRQYLLEVAYLSNVNKIDAEKYIDEYLELFEIKNLIKKNPSKLCQDNRKKYYLSKPYYPSLNY